MLLCLAVNAKPNKIYLNRMYCVVLVFAASAVSLSHTDSGTDLQIEIVCNFDNCGEGLHVVEFHFCYCLRSLLNDVRVAEAAPAKTTIKTRNVYSSLTMALLRSSLMRLLCERLTSRIPCYPRLPKTIC